jgi:Ca-activated chloride channel homolog
MISMRITLVLVLFVAVLGCLGSRTAEAQSGREGTITGGKSNRRPVQPSPSPSPTPLTTAAAVDPGSDAIPADDDGETIKVDTQLVSIPVRVMDKKGRFIAGLSKDNFKVFTDGVEQEVALFSNEEQPFTVALVLDMSYSTNFKIAEIQSAAISFIDQLRPQDRVMVISFDEEVHMLCEPTNDRKAIYRAIRSTRIATGTSLYEAVEMVMNDRLRRIDGRKAIILFTDGVDTTSRRTGATNNISDAMELDALIYPIRYDTYADVQRMKNGTVVPPISSPIPGQTGNNFPFPIPTIGGAPQSQGTSERDYEEALRYLQELAERTGGRIYLADSLGNLSGSFAKIASELREYYSLGIYPTDIKAGKLRRVKVKLSQEGLVVRARDTFVVGSKSKK